MIVFWCSALVLLLVALAFVLYPMFSLRSQTDADRTEFNLALYRDRKAFLEQQLADQLIEPAELEIQLVELQQNLLSDVDRLTNNAPQDAGIAKKTAAREALNWQVVIFAASLFVPLCTLLIYTDLGMSKGAISEVFATERISDVDLNDEASVTAMVSALEQMLLRNPEHDSVRFMLARAYMRMARFAEAVSAFSELRLKYPTDEGIAAGLAEALFLTNGEVLTEVVREAIDAVLAINPNSVSMLEILAMDAFRRNDLPTAKAYFKQASEYAVPERAAVIRQVLAQLAGNEVATEVAPTDSNSKEKTEPMRSVSVLVELSPDVILPSPASVFVFAKAAVGPAMPLAVKKLSSDELPALVELTEAMAMFPGVSLRDFSEVILVARISESGMADPSPEDLEVVSDIIQLEENQAVIRLQISEPRGG
jgi:cytochrome c-type biogenesis protein CcmH